MHRLESVLSVICEHVGVCVRFVLCKSNNRREYAERKWLIFFFRLKTCYFVENQFSFYASSSVVVVVVVVFFIEKYFASNHFFFYSFHIFLWSVFVLLLILALLIWYFVCSLCVLLLFFLYFISFLFFNFLGFFLRIVFNRFCFSVCCCYC